MKLPIMFVGTLVSLMFQSTNVQVMQGSSASTTLQIAKDGQSVQAELHQERLRITCRSGALRTVDLLMLYEPQRGLFWWKSENADAASPITAIDQFQSHSIPYITDSKLVSFTYYAHHLVVQESASTFPSTSAGEAFVIAKLEGSRDEVETGTFEQSREISFLKQVGIDFFTVHGSASPFPEPKLREVRRIKNQWWLVLDGPNADSATLVLSDDYKLISATRTAH